MKSDLPAAAVRLLASCAVRTHEQAFPVNKKAADRAARKKAKRPYHEASNRGRGGHNAIAVIIDGQRYASIKIAARALHIGNTRIYGLLDAGTRARYAGKHG